MLFLVVKLSSNFLFVNCFDISILLDYPIVTLRINLGRPEVGSTESIKALGSCLGGIVFVVSLTVQHFGPVKNLAIKEDL